MRKSGGIVALIAGLLAFIAAVFTLVVGGIGSNFNAEAGDTIISVGWSGILISFLIIVLGAVAMYAKTFIPGILIIFASIFGVIYGGSLVAVLMLLALVGGVLACIGDGNLQLVEMDAQEAKSMTRKSLIKSVTLAVVILGVVLFLSKHNPPVVDNPVSITIPDDTKLTEEPTTIDSLAVAASAPPAETLQSHINNMHFDSFLGKPALEILADEGIQQISKKLLKSHYDKFLTNLAVSSGLEMDSNYLLGFGCSESICPTEQAAFAIDKQTGEMFAILISSEGDRLFGVNSVDKLPANLQSWYEHLDK